MFLFNNSVSENYELRFMLNFITPQEFEENAVVKKFIKTDKFSPKANKLDCTEKTKAILNVSSGGIIILDLKFFIFCYLHFFQKKKKICSPIQKKSNRLSVQFINVPAVEMFVLHNQLKNLKQLKITSLFHHSQQAHVRKMVNRALIIKAKKKFEKDLQKLSDLNKSMLNIRTQTNSTQANGQNNNPNNNTLNDEEKNTLEIIGVRELNQDQQFPTLLHVSFGWWKKKRAITMFCRDISIEKKNQSLLEEEKKKSESLLLNILPYSVRQQVQSGKKKLIANYHQDISVLFCQICGIKGIISVGSMKPDEIIATLNLIVDAFDELAKEHMFEKIKTIGDVYFAVSGLHNNKQNHPESSVWFGIDMILALEKISKQRPEIADVSLKIGCNTGPATSGVIGKTKFQWDVWGDTINTGSRMESTGLKLSFFPKPSNIFFLTKNSNLFPHKSSLCKSSNLKNNLRKSP